MKISATSVMLPRHDLREAAALLGELGFDGAEWRCRYVPANQAQADYSFWGRHAYDLRPDNLRERGPEMLRVSTDHGLAVPCLATNVAATDLDTVRLLAEGCGELGVPAFKVGAPRGWSPAEHYPTLLDDSRRAYEAVVAICAEHGVKALLEVHRGTVAMSPTMAYLVVRDFDPAHLGVIFDIANMSLGQGFEPPEVGLALLGAHVAHVHAGGGRPRPTDRRADGQQAWAWDTVDLADSMLDTAGFLVALQASGYAGYVTFEDFRGEAPETLLARNLAFLRSCEAGA